MHAFLIGGKIEKIKLYVPQTAEFYKQRMGGERMRAAKPTNRETFTRFIYARKIKRYRTGNVRYRLKQNVTNAGCLEKRHHAEKNPRNGAAHPREIPRYRVDPVQLFQRHDDRLIEIAEIFAE